MKCTAVLFADLLSGFRTRAKPECVQIRFLHPDFQLDWFPGEFFDGIVFDRDLPIGGIPEMRHALITVSVQIQQCKTCGAFARSCKVDKKTVPLIAEGLCQNNLFLGPGME